MSINRICYIIVTSVIMITLLLLTKNIFASGAITIVTVMAGYVIISYMRSKKRLDLLEEKCDPQAFIEATERQRKITGKNPKINTYLNIDKTAGLMELGEYQKAKEVLTLIDKCHLSAKNGTLLVYVINLILCSYELGEISYAEELFETQVPLLSPVNTKMAQVVEFLIAYRLFYLNRFEESKEKYQKLLKEKISRRKKLDILYTLAKIDETNGDIDSATQKYKKVADNGCSLWSVQQSRKRLEAIFLNNI